MAVGAALVLSSGVALAANVIPCPGGLCEGTTGDDEMTGTSATYYIYAKEGNDTLRGLGAFDDLRGGPGNDDLNGGGATTSTTSTTTTGERTASPATVPEQRTG